jgi:hypothetical protein
VRVKTFLPDKLPNRKGLLIGKQSTTDYVVDKLPAIKGLLFRKLTTQRQKIIGKITEITCTH